MWKSEHLRSIPSSSTVSCVTLGKSLNFSKLIYATNVYYLLTSVGLGAEKSMIHAMKKKCRMLCGEGGEPSSNLVAQAFPEEMTLDKMNDEQEWPRSNGRKHVQDRGNSMCTGPAVGGTWHFELLVRSKKSVGRAI